MDKIKKRSLITEKLLAVFLIYVIILGILFVYSVKTGIAKIKKQNTQIKSTNQTISILTKKIDQLKSFAPLALKYNESLAYSLPSKSPTLVVYSNIKRMATEYGVVVEDVRLSNTSQEANPGELVKGNFGFTLAGSMENILSYLNGVYKIAPIIEVKRVQFEGVADEVLAESSLVSFWAKPIEKLSSVTQPLDELTKEDMGLLDKTLELIRPDLEEPASSGPSSRTNPF